MDIFSIIPIEAAMDSRLSKNHYRVLIALLSFRTKNTDTVWPSRESLSARCGLPITRISEITSSLCSLGWLEKDGKGGFSKSTRYRITIPETIIEPVTVTTSVTVTESVTDGVTEPVTTTITESVTGKEQTIEHTKEQTKKNSGASIKKPDEVDQQVWDDYMRIRKAKKSPMTETAMRILKSECLKSGYSLNQALQECVSRGWQGFKAEWVMKKGSVKSPAEQEESDRRFREWLGGDDAIEGEIVK